jgi:DNA primase
MFPIHSMSGRILGFGGRILNNQLKTAKYLNSPESLIYNKSKIFTVSSMQNKKLQNKTIVISLKVIQMLYSCIKKE